jgi:hypothetical protein
MAGKLHVLSPALDASNLLSGNLLSADILLVVRVPEDGLKSDEYFALSVGLIKFAAMGFEYGHDCGDEIHLGYILRRWVLGGGRNLRGWAAIWENAGEEYPYG